MSIEPSRKQQTSETFLVSAILSFSGGLQDAYTYYSRDKVFANAQTGNVVIMSKLFMTGYFKEALQYLAPVSAFALGILITEYIGYIAHNKYKGHIKIHWRQVVLFLEVVILFAVGFIPSNYNMLASSLVSLSCAMQVEAFKTVHGFVYASTMCIGNLRCAMESLSVSVRDKNKEARVRMYYYYGVIVTFAIGSGVGGILSEAMEMRAIWVCCLLLLVCCILMFKKHSVFRKSSTSKYFYNITHNHYYYHHHHHYNNNDNNNKKNKKNQNKDDNDKSSTKMKMISEISSSQNVYVDIDIDAGMIEPAQSNSIRNVVMDDYLSQNEFIQLDEATINSINNNKVNEMNDITKQSNTSVMDDTGQTDITKLENEVIIMNTYDGTDTDVATEVNHKNSLRLEEIQNDPNFNLVIDRGDKYIKDGASTSLSLSTTHQTIVVGDNISQVDNSFKLTSPPSFQKETTKLDYPLRNDNIYYKDHTNMENIIIDNINQKDTIKVEDLMIKDTHSNKLDLMNPTKMESITVNNTIRNDSIN
ncbi:DUF1275-domain-containing protein [Piromyces finnis]|uniref:DUF1275-domain-containing protein n=1 Tax=Piromyces finnis TaxID=1754191 RepID=A0A1Y1VJH8_9FUNG|nr:DUF1275-domain-containing protein [Piromyces finnis]|eukprot:ORX57871.1 DUF1275-domain-containing protein [Piromyces finnis]